MLRQLDPSPLDPSTTRPIYHSTHLQLDRSIIHDPSDYEFETALNERIGKTSLLLYEGT